jgi:hypothetical protein
VIAQALLNVTGCLDLDLAQYVVCVMSARVLSDKLTHKLPVLFEFPLYVFMKKDSSLNVFDDGALLL